MAELLTHALTGLVLAVVLSWWVDWIDPPLIVMAMLGAILPDLNRLGLVVPSHTIEAVIGIPWSWMVLHTVGGVALVIAMIVVLVPRRLAIPVGAMLVLGASSHLALDYLLWQADGLASPLLWPITDWQLAFDGFYLSTDRWPTVIAIAVTGVVLTVDRYRASSG